MALQVLTFVVIAALSTALFGACDALLYAKESSSREVKELNGLWHFRADYSPGRDAGFTEEWYKEPLPKTGDTILMPVPSSFNDITQNVSLKNYIGWVWYDREFWLPKAWTDNKTRVMLRLESAQYNAIGWVNGIQVTNHSGGHLPFEGEITDYVTAGKPNRVTVAVNNTLSPHTLPPGTLTFGGPPEYPKGYVVQHIQADFFNYAGLHRPVKLYTTPSEVHVDDITVTSSLESNGSAVVNYIVEVQSSSPGVTVQVKLMERMGRVAARASLNYKLRRCQKALYCSKAVKGSVVVDDPHLWWPWTMNEEAGYLYVLQVTATTEDGVEDMYRLPVGIRTVAVQGTQFLINNKPFYFLGMGKHEDADIRGKGLDYPLIMKDVNLIRWLGANSFRTSHYPYAEELMDLCDKNGIVVVDESPAVGLTHPDNFADETLAHHLEVMTELVQRDKNRPSVVMWSVANEPSSELAIAEAYFKKVIDHTRSLDPTRPVTFACNQAYNTDRVVQFVDVICINRYYGWYQDQGHPEAITMGLSYELSLWYAKHGKPMMITEYGAGTIAGFHKDPPVMFTEDFQVEVLMDNFEVFDEYRGKFLVGEMIWNFADFETDQSTSRVDGNKKGILTRQRQPKTAARLIRQRYLSLAQGRQLCYDHSLHGFSDRYHCTNPF